MNRRKPRLDVAVVPQRAGEDRAAAVLRKAVATALAAIAEQGAADPHFTFGYAAGFARQQALKHGLDAEADGGLALMSELSAQHGNLGGPGLAPRPVGSSRCALGFAEPLADAGYLVGHLESLCGTRRLLDTGGGLAVYLTQCDHAADRMQTHHPTAALRFDASERAVIAAALG